MDVTDILKRAEADVQEAKAASEAAQARAAAAAADADAALEREKSMQAVLAWIQQQATVPAKPAEQVSPPAATRFGRPIPEVTQTELVLRVLEELGRPMSTKEIRDRLARDGHVFSQNQVRSTLKYMAKRSSPKVTTESGSGVWRLRHTAATPAMNGASRGP